MKSVKIAKSFAKIYIEPRASNLEKMKKLGMIGNIKLTACRKDFDERGKGRDCDLSDLKKDLERHSFERKYLSIY
jgi:hypothetical protein